MNTVEKPPEAVDAVTQQIDETRTTTASRLLHVMAIIDRAIDEGADRFVTAVLRSLKAAAVTFYQELVRPKRDTAPDLR